MRRAGRKELADALRETRDSIWLMLDSLEPEQWTVPRWDTLNPPLWEIGHVGWFQELWCLRQPGRGSRVGPSRLQNADAWFDSSRIAHADRWALALPPAATLRAWLDDVLGESIERLAQLPDSDAGLYWHRLALFHEQFHLEAFGYTWHALGYRQPGAAWAPPPPIELKRDARLAGGPMLLGSPPDDGFVFDNEKWAHPVTVAPFEISLQPITNAEFLQFVEDGGYRDPRWWPDEAMARLRADERTAPAGWRRERDRWTMRWFERRVPVEPFAPLLQVDAYEADAFCAWAGRRLPTEIEWEFAASTCEDFDWGDSVWEWTSSAFEPFPGFEIDPYRDYSAPSFGGTHRVVRGGSFATPAGLPHPRLRNFFAPDRRDLFVGFRTCARR